MSNWLPTPLGWNCYDCGSFCSQESDKAYIEKDCTNTRCRLGKCECGAPLEDGGVIGLYCSAGLECPVERKLFQSIRWHQYLKAIGISRMSDNEKALLVCFNRKPTDDEMRRIHDMLR